MTGELTCAPWRNSAHVRPRHTPSFERSAVKRGQIYSKETPGELTKEQGGIEGQQDTRQIMDHSSYREEDGNVSESELIVSPVSEGENESGQLVLEDTHAGPGLAWPGPAVR